MNAVIVEKTYQPQAWYRDGIRLMLILGLACSLFSGTVALLLPVAFTLSDFHEEGLNLRLLLKGGVFMFSALICLMTLMRFPRETTEPGDVIPERFSISSYLQICFCISMYVLLLSPNLDGYPWTAPDELHHLVVAKNLAEHHAYASGHPETGFGYFDPYDSVGVSVLGPIAVLFKIFGTSIMVGRCFTVFSMILLAIGLFRLLYINGYMKAGAVGCIFLLTSFGSVYLSRSLYGEVPALMFLVWGLVSWQKALSIPKISGWSVMAGVLFGFAVLAKMFMFIAAFAFAAVYLSDLVGGRRMRWHHVFLPAGIVLGLMGAWWILVGMYTDSGGSMVVYYRHYLMFGLDGAREGLRWFLYQPLYMLVMLFALVGSIPVFSKTRWSPPLLVLLVLAVLYGFWWVFFTPGTIPRYLWYTCAVLGVFSAFPFWEAIKRINVRYGKPGMQLVFISVIILIVADAGSRLYEQADLVYRHDQAADERELATYLSDFSSETRMATTYWPAELSMNFMTSRVVTVVSDWETGLQQYDLVIMNRDFTPIPDSLQDGTKHIGRYVIVSNTTQEGIVD